ncbi:MAG: hypothetical protein HKN07_06495, partial [Acidimicrobiia bacterium]|nr:hypothetical protein [Acidimicrobiia bacterium]
MLAVVLRGGANVVDGRKIAGPHEVDAPVSPNPIAVAWSMLRALRVRRPVPADTGAATVDHSSLANALATLASQGIESVDARTLLTYRDELAATDPNDLSSDVAL